ncbi:MAG: hypothetical protein IJ033_01460 [Clostridia bacterium]|nr:hypothetical protein [Clostridia bacterium]
MLGGAFLQYKSLLKVFLSNLIALPSKKQVTEKTTGAKKLGKIGVLALAAFGFVSIFAYLILVAYELTVASINSGRVVELQYAFMAMAQITVLLFGLASLLNNLYFAKDNALLCSLPFKKGVVFLSKFTMTYLGELLFAALVYLPLTITSLVTLMQYDYPGVNGLSFVVVVINLLFIPALPLLAATLISQPLMRLVSLLKKRTLGNSLVMALCYVAFFALYFPLVIGVSTVGETGVLGGDMIGAFVALKNYTIFNYPLVNATLNNNVLLNLVIYFAGVLVVGVISVLLSFVFYKKSLMKLSEGDGIVAKKVKNAKNTANSTIKSFLIKDFKTLLHTPQLLINCIMVIVLPSIIIAFMSGEFGQSMLEEEFASNINTNVFVLSLATYLVALLSCAGNPFGYIGFSIEGKNLYMLKSLPISHKDVIKSKFIFSVLITAVSSLVLLIVFPFASGIKNAVAIVGLPLQSFATGISFSAIGLYSDLKNPNLNWVNINEITRNNLKTIKPMMLYLALSFVYLIVGIVLAVLMQAITLNEYLVVTVYYVICLTAPVVIFVLYFKKLLNAEDLMSKIGG